MKSLLDAVEGVEYKVGQVVTEDEELDAFLFSLGCYEGATIVLVSKRSGGYVVSIKDGRYTIDENLAGVIGIQEEHTA